MMMALIGVSRSSLWSLVYIYNRINYCGLGAVALTLALALDT